MKNLIKTDKYYLYSRLIEILVMNGENFDEYLFMPLSKIDFYEDKYEVEKEDKLLNIHPKFKEYFYS